MAAFRTNSDDTSSTKPAFGKSENGPVWGLRTTACGAQKGAGSDSADKTQAPEPRRAEAHSSHKNHNRWNESVDKVASASNIRAPEPPRVDAQSLPFTHTGTRFRTIVTSVAVQAGRGRRDTEETIGRKEETIEGTQNSTTIPICHQSMGDTRGWWHRQQRSYLH